MITTDVNQLQKSSGQVRACQQAPTSHPLLSRTIGNVGSRDVAGVVGCSPSYGARGCRQLDSLQPLVFGGSYPIDEPLSARERSPDPNHQLPQRCRQVQSAEDQNMNGDNDHYKGRKAYGEEDDIGRSRFTRGVDILSGEPKLDVNNLLYFNDSQLSGVGRMNRQDGVLTVSQTRTYPVDAICCLPPNLCEEHALAAADSDKSVLEINSHLKIPLQSHAISDNECNDVDLLKATANDSDQNHLDTNERLNKLLKKNYRNLCNSLNSPDSGCVSSDISSCREATGKSHDNVSNQRSVELGHAVVCPYIVQNPDDNFDHPDDTLNDLDDEEEDLEQDDEASYDEVDEEDSEAGYFCEEGTIPTEVAASREYFTDDSVQSVLRKRAGNVVYQTEKKMFSDSMVYPGVTTPSQTHDTPPDMRTTGSLPSLPAPSNTPGDPCSVLRNAMNRCSAEALRQSSGAAGMGPATFAFTVPEPDLHAQVVAKIQLTAAN